MNLENIHPITFQKNAIHPITFRKNAKHPIKVLLKKSTFL